MLGEVRKALDDPEWSSSLAQVQPQTVRATQPLLHGCELLVDGHRLRNLMHRLLKIASAETTAGSPAIGEYRPSADMVLALVAVSIRNDRPAMAELAAGAGVDPGALEPVAQLSALPLLQSCGRLLQEQVPGSWTHGYCPICGSWPLLGEFRSLDRTRRLRCGRCGGDWKITWLRCPYCGETHHERLRSLVLDSKMQALTVETCLHCRGYLKSITTLQAIPPFELLLRDLETVELDLAALDRGYARAEGTGFPVDVQIVMHAPAARPSRHHV
jgi:FdhE protein